MDEKELRQYRSICKQIEHIDRQIEKECDKEIGIIHSKAAGSSPEFPYTKMYMGIEAYEPKRYSESLKRIKELRNKCDELSKRKKEIEWFIESIEDEQTKAIFQYRFIDGLSQEKAGELIGYTQGRISQIIRRLL